MNIPIQPTERSKYLTILKKPRRRPHTLAGFFNLFYYIIYIAVCEAKKDTTNLMRLKNELAETERKHKNLMNAVMECDNDSFRICK